MDEALKNSTQGKVAYTWRIERFQIDTIKFERKQIHFFSDFFTVVVVVASMLNVAITYNTVNLSSI